MPETTELDRRAQVEQFARDLHDDYSQWLANRLLEDAPDEVVGEGVFTLAWKALPSNQRRQWRWVAGIMVDAGFVRRDEEPSF